MRLKMWWCFVKRFEIHWHTPFFRSRQICGRISRSPFWLPESALELSTGRCWKRQSQMVQVHNDFSLKCSRIIRLMLEYCYCAHDPETASWQLQGHLQSPFIIIKMFSLRNTEEIQIRLNHLFPLRDINDIPKRH